jgi:serine/threonine protein kinase
MHLCAGQHTNIVELRALCQHEAALYMVMVSSFAVKLLSNPPFVVVPADNSPRCIWSSGPESSSGARCSAWQSCSMLGASTSSSCGVAHVGCACTTALSQEFFPRGTMEVMLHHTAAKRWDTAKLLLIIRSIASGVQYLHTRSPPILHRDIKPGNLFVGVSQVRSGPWPGAQRPVAWTYQQQQFAEQLLCQPHSCTRGPAAP